LAKTWQQGVPASSNARFGMGKDNQFFSSLALQFSRKSALNESLMGREMDELKATSLETFPYFSEVFGRIGLNPMVDSIVSNIDPVSYTHLTLPTILRV